MEDEFSDDGLNDQDLLDAGNYVYVFASSGNANSTAVDGHDFSHIDDFDQKAGIGGEPVVPQARLTSDEESPWSPTQLLNGKWACNHKCKNKTS